jgi:basic membrane protein A and related proteins
MARRFLVVVLASAVAAATLSANGPVAGGAARQLRVVVVLEPGGPTGPYNSQAVAALRRAVRELGVEGRAVTLSPKEDWAARFSSLAAQGYDVVIGLGFLQADAVDAAAVNFPDTTFAMLDMASEELDHKPKNVAGTIFREHEAGYLAGYLAALMERRRPGKDVISSVGGLPLPAVKRFIAGYVAGAKKAVPRITLLSGYSGTFYDPAKCKPLALTQIAKGSGAVFQVAAVCGIGALNAAKQRGIWGIGVDVDQSSLGPHILTSAIKRLDVAGFRMIKMFKEGKLRGGRNIRLGVTDGGVGLGKISPRVPRLVVAQVERIRKQVASGTIKVPSAIG